jgi:hypothetical protein
VVPVAVLAAFALGACGGGGDGVSDGVASLDDEVADAASEGSAAPTATTEPVDQEEALLEFAACMRENGVDMPDPEVDDNGGVLIQIGDGEQEPGAGPPEGVEEAMDECGELMPRGPVERNGEEFDPTEMQDEMLAFAQCMRDHGIDMPDPDFGEDGRLEAGSDTESADAGGSGPVLRGPFGTLDPSDPATEAAFEECGEGTMFGLPGGAAVGAAPVDDTGDDE